MLFETKYDHQLSEMGSCFLFPRKNGLLANTAFGILAAILMFFSKMAGSYEMIIIGRFFIGVNCGMQDCLNVVISKFNILLSPFYLITIQTYHVDFVCLKLFDVSFLPQICNNILSLFVNGYLFH